MNPLRTVDVRAQLVVQRIVEREHPRSSGDSAACTSGRSSASDTAAAACRAGSRTRASPGAAPPCDWRCRRATVCAFITTMLPARPSEEHLVRVRRQRIGEHVLRPRAPLVRARDHARRAVVGREVVQHPDGVADPVAALVGHRRPCRRAAAGRRRACGSAERAFRLLNLHRGAEHLPHALEHLRQHDRPAEHLALVDQVGEAVRVLLRLELAARRVALVVEELA